ncbi:MAG: ABC transporter substrate-binding protein [Dehalococcoidia bacterium]|nr:ABC transporter substrate-binding protein [Dehalococcoidia bacterium]
MRIWTKSGGLVVVAIVSCALLLVACSPTASSPAASGTAAPSNKPSGSLKVAAAFGNGNIDPQIGTAVVFQAIGSPILSSLVELDANAQPVPGIAERWEISADGLSHTFFIRKGVKFHDGSDLTGADVKFSIERIMAPECTHVDAAVWRASIAGVDLKDDYTVVMRLKAPLFDLLKGFADLTGSPAVVPKKYIEEKGVDNFRSRPVGSGPWKVVSYERGSRLELEANENYWGAVPKFKNITLINVTEEASIVAQLKTGELDMASVQPDSVAGLKSAGLRVFGFRGGGAYMAMAFYDMEHPDKSPLGNVKVRKALSYAVNRKEMSDKILQGYGEPAVVYPVSPKAYFFDPSVLKSDPFDPEGAKKLLTEAGYASGFPTKVWDTAPGSLTSVLDQALTGYWRNIGVQASIQTIDYSAMVAMYVPKQKPEIWESYFPTIGVKGFQFEKMVTSYHFTKGAVKNANNPTLDQLIDKVPVTKDLAEKKKIALEATLLAKNEFTTPSFLEVQELLALGAKIGELTPIDGLRYLGPVFNTITHAK